MVVIRCTSRIYFGRWQLHLEWKCNVCMCGQTWFTLVYAQSTPVGGKRAWSILESGKRCRWVSTVASHNVLFLSACHSGTLYAGEHFQLQFTFSDHYPFDSPQVKERPGFHPIKFEWILQHAQVLKLHQHCFEKEMRRFDLACLGLHQAMCTEIRFTVSCSQEEGWGSGVRKREKEMSQIDMILALSGRKPIGAFVAEQWSKFALWVDLLPGLVCYLGWLCFEACMSMMYHW